MASLQVRELPAHIKRKLEEAAAKEHRSIAQQAVVAIEKGLGVSADIKTRRKMLAERIKTMSTDMIPKDLPSSVDLIHEDRYR